MKLEQHLAKDFKTYFICKNKQLVILEDLFGKADINFNKDTHSTLLEVLKPHVHKGLSKFIITVRNYQCEDVSEIVKQHELMSQASIINLNGKFSLSLSEKKKILTVHAEHHGIKIVSKALYLRPHFRLIPKKEKYLTNFHIQKIIATDPYLGFPEACRLFCSFENFFAIGSEFFTSPTEGLKKEIRRLKQSGYTDNISALQYSVLVFLMLEIACEDYFATKIGKVTNDINEPLNNYKNVNTSVIKYLHNTLFDRKILVGTDDLEDVCTEISDKYIKQGVNSNIYIYQHNTVFEAVLFSFWDGNTRSDFIKHASLNTLVEYVRPFDCVVKRFARYLFVPKSDCCYLAQTLFELFQTSYTAALKCAMIVENSEFTLILLVQKLTEWYRIEGNVLKCEWNTISAFIRPSNYRNESRKLCAYANNISLIQRLIKVMHESDKSWGVEYYINHYGCKEFVNDFYEKLTEWLHLGDNILNCSWDLINSSVRPNTFKKEHVNNICFTNDSLLIQKLLIEFVKPVIYKCRALEVEQYINMYGCKAWVKDFNDKLTIWFRSEENVADCCWELLYHFIRPSTFKIETEKIGTHTTDLWLIQRIFNKLIQTYDVEKKSDIKSYISTYGCDIFIKDFNETLTKWFQSEEHIVSCSWDLLYHFVRPTTYVIENGEIGSFTFDNLLIQRLIREFATSVYNQRNIKRYILEYGCDKFVNDFKEHIAQHFLSEKDVFNCPWNLIDALLRPTNFYKKDDKMCISINNCWLIQRILKEFEEPDSVHTCPKQYIEEYGFEHFINCLNEKVKKRIKSEEDVLHCSLGLFYNFLRPKTFTIETGKKGVNINDSWITHRLINEFRNDNNDYRIQSYIELYGCEKIVKDLNENLSEFFKSEEVILKCSWKMIDNVVRPMTYNNDGGKICTVDSLLITRLIKELEVPGMESLVYNYIRKYGCTEFVENFNDKLKYMFQSKEYAVDCSWTLIISFVRPKTYKIANSEIGTCLPDSWLIERVINELLDTSYLIDTSKQNNFMSYIKKYGSVEFVEEFNKKYAEFFQTEENIIECNWTLINYFFRPTIFKVETGKVGANVSNNKWLIKRIVNELMRPDINPFVNAFFYSTSDISNINERKETDRQLEVKKYVQNYGCQEFVNAINTTLSKMIQSENDTVECGWTTVESVVRPSTFQIEKGKIGIRINNSSLIQRLITELDRNTLDVKRYIEQYGCKAFIIDFNEKLTVWLQSEINVKNFKWDLIYYFVRPSMFEIKHGIIGTTVCDVWLIHRIVKELVEPGQNEHHILNAKQYIEQYGCAELHQAFNKKLEEWILSNMKICSWDLFKSVVRPISLHCNAEKIRTCIADQQVITYLCMKLNQKVSVHDIKDYVSLYSSSTLVEKFKEVLKEKVKSVNTIDQDLLEFYSYFDNYVDFDEETQDYDSSEVDSDSSTNSEDCDS